MPEDDGESRPLNQLLAEERIRRWIDRFGVGTEVVVPGPAEPRMEDYVDIDWPAPPLLEEPEPYEEPERPALNTSPQLQQLLDLRRMQRENSQARAQALRDMRRARGPIPGRGLCILRQQQAHCPRSCPCNARARRTRRERTLELQRRFNEGFDRQPQPFTWEEVQFSGTTTGTDQVAR